MSTRLRGSIIVKGLLVYFLYVLVFLKATVDAESLTATKLNKLLILAYPRTGSSFAGKILSASPNASFIFEPLFRFEPFGHSVDAWSIWNASVRSHVETHMEALFNCDNDTMYHITHNYNERKHKRDKYCNESNPRVMKTIRLHKRNLDPWILDSDIKVVHLIRDPRAVYASMAKKPRTWKGYLENVDGMCKKMMGDILLGSKLPSDRYFLLNFEKFITSPNTTLVDLYSTLNMEFDPLAVDTFYNHTRSKKDPRLGVNKYYSTYRTADYDIYKWKKQLRMEKIRHIEENCVEFMQKVGFDIFKPSVSRANTALKINTLPVLMFGLTIVSKTKMALGEVSLSVT